MAVAARLVQGFDKRALEVAVETPRLSARMHNRDMQLNGSESKPFSREGSRVASNPFLWRRRQGTRSSAREIQICEEIHP